MAYPQPQSWAWQRPVESTRDRSAAEISKTHSSNEATISGVATASSGKEALVETVGPTSTAPDNRTQRSLPVTTVRLELNRTPESRGAFANRQDSDRFERDEPSRVDQPLLSEQRYGAPRPRTGADFQNEGTRRHPFFVMRGNMSSGNITLERSKWHAMGEYVVAGDVRGGRFTIHSCELIIKGVCRDTEIRLKNGKLEIFKDSHAVRVRAINSVVGFHGAVTGHSHMIQATTSMHIRGNFENSTIKTEGGKLILQTMVSGRAQIYEGAIDIVQLRQSATGAHIELSHGAKITSRGWPNLSEQMARIVTRHSWPHFVFRG